MVLLQTYEMWERGDPYGCAEGGSNRSIDLSSSSWKYLFDSMCILKYLSGDVDPFTPVFGGYHMFPVGPIAPLGLPLSNDPLGDPLFL